MSLSGLSFLIAEAAKNIRRNGLMSLAALTTVAISMAVLGGALFTLYRLHQFAEAQPRQFEIAVFLRGDVDRDDVEGIRKRILAIPGVATVSLTTKEQALADLQQKDAAAGTGIASALGGNPLPDTLNVRLSDPHANNRVASILRSRNRFPEVEGVREDRETLEKLFMVQRVIRNVGGVAAALLLLATAFVIQNTIRLTVLARRREIRIMQLVGATPGFIRLPLVLEGIFYGVAGSLIAGGLVLFVVAQVSSYGSRLVSPIAQTMPPALGPQITLSVFVCLGAVIGWIGSALSIRRFLKRV